MLCVVYSVTLQSHFNDHFETRHSILCCQVLSQLHIYAIKLGYLSNCYSLHLFDFLGASSANRKFLLMQLKMFRTVLTLLKKCIGQLNVQLKLTQVRKNSYLKTKLNNIKIGQIKLEGVELNNLKGYKWVIGFYFITRISWSVHKNSYIIICQNQSNNHIIL